MKSLLLKCEQIAREAHKGQFRWDKKTPYITHPEAVANSLNGDFLKCVAWLHDVLEDTNLTVIDLENEHVNKQIIDAVVLLTKIDGQLYVEYIKKLKDSNNQLAIQVKLADMAHNRPTSTKGNKVKYDLSKYILETDLYNACVCGLSDDITL